MRHRKHPEIPQHPVMLTLAHLVWVGTRLPWARRPLLLPTRRDRSANLTLRQIFVLRVQLPLPRPQWVERIFLHQKHLEPHGHQEVP